MELIDPSAPTAAQICTDVRAGRRTPQDVVEACLARIAAVDDRIGAFQFVDAAGARRDAEQVARRRDLADLPLAGVPVAIKDNIDVAGMPARHGSGATSPLPRPSDDLLVTRLREAGAIIVGKTRLPELGIWDFTESKAHGGTRNPRNPRRNAGGSTGGGAAAVAAGMVPVALGNDGGGSLRIPAANCGVVGFKPSRGLVPIEADQTWFGCTEHGPIATSVADVALVLDVLAGTDRFRGPQPPSAPLRVAVALRSPSPIGQPDATARTGLADAAARARRAGHHVVTATPPYPLSLVNDWVRRWHAGVASEVRRLGLAVADLEPRTQIIVRKGERLLRRGRPRPKDGQPWLRSLDAWFEAFDVLLSPVVARPTPSFGWGANAGYGRAYLRGAYSAPYTQAWNLAGFAGLSLPVRLPRVPPGADRQPGAVQIVAPRGQESTVLALASQLE